MEISPQIAQSIVTSMNGIFHHEINFFDSSGTIIASTDRKRIGTGHDGARLALKSKKSVVIDDEHEFEGAKHGINVPVLFQGTAVAAIGIVGEEADVVLFGDMLGKMTEILLRENWAVQSRFDQREDFAELVEMLTREHPDMERASMLASVLKVDLAKRRLAVVGHADVPFSSELVSEASYSEVYGALAALSDGFYSLTERGIIIFAGEADNARIEHIVEGLINRMEQRFGVHMRFGIGDWADDASEYQMSYREALITAEWLFTRDRQGSVRRYSYSIGQSAVIAFLPDREKRKLVEVVYGDMTNEEIADTRNLIGAYIRHNGSITKAAEELYLHKNTFQYKLNRITAKTGYNPRSLGDLIMLVSATTSWDFLQVRERSGFVG